MNTCALDPGGVFVFVTHMLTAALRARRSTLSVVTDATGGAGGSIALVTTNGDAYAFDLLDFAGHLTAGGDALADIAENYVASGHARRIRRPHTGDRLHSVL